MTPEAEKRGRSMTRYAVPEMAGEVARQRAQVEAMTSPLDADAFGWRETPGRWSVGECLDHLTLMNRIYLDLLEDVAARASEAGVYAADGGADDGIALPVAGVGRRRPRRHGWVGDWFVRAMEPSSRMKVGTFRSTTPDPQRPREVALGEWMATQDRLARAIDGARGLDLARVRTRSPFLRLLPLSLGQAFGAVLAHNRRHISQAERVIEARTRDGSS